MRIAFPGRASRFSHGARSPIRDERGRANLGLHSWAPFASGAFNFGWVLVSAFILIGLTGCNPESGELQIGATDVATTTVDRPLPKEHVDLIQTVLEKAQSEIDTGQFDDAIKTCGQVLNADEITGNSGPTASKKIASVRFLQAVALRGKGDTNSAIDDFDFAIAHGDEATRSNAHLQRAKIKFEFEEWRVVLDDCTSAMVLTSNRSEALFLRGQAFLKINAPDIAIEDFREALVNTDSDFRSRVYVARAEAHEELQNWRDVLDDSTAAIRELPSNGEAFLLRGKAFTEFRQVEQAKIAFDEARRLKVSEDLIPIPPPSLLADMSAGASDSKQVTLMAGQEEPLNDNTLIARAEAQLDAGEIAVAREMLESASAFDENGLETNRLRARVNYDLGDFQRAIRDSTRALRIDPKCADAYRTRGLSHLSLDKLDQAILDFNSAIELDPSKAEALTPKLAEAKRKGGLDPRIRSRSITKIKQWVAIQPSITTTPSSQEKWLLDVMKMTNSSKQVAKLRRLLEAEEGKKLESMLWLADYLMVRGGGSDVDAMRAWLSGWDRAPEPDAEPDETVANDESKTEEEVETLESQLRDAIISRSTAAANGVDVYPDLATYALAYGFDELLQECYRTGICRGEFAHHLQAIGSDDTTGLRIVLPTVPLDDREVELLLQRCIDQQKPDHARFVIAKYESGLSAKVLTFLDLAEDPERLIGMR